MNIKAVKILAIIGARSGSRNIPHKNIRLLAGRPLLAWPILAAKRSQYINRIIVSTDSPEYAKIAREWGAETPFLQPPEVSHDLATEVDFISHALEWLKKNEGYTPDIVARLFATVPLKRTEDVDRCIEMLLNDPEAHSAVAIAEAHQHPHKALKIAPDGKHVVTYITNSGRDVTPLQRQRYEKAYFRQGNIIAVRYDVFQKYRSLTGDRVRYHVVPQEFAVDVDSELDFFLVEKLVDKLCKEGKMRLT